ncbi:hypothetical protein FOL47_004041 [Perkinsus chesapeaki]|uniref:Uncharacterized protein n=1 Tax=Perkinsus chesapeaki TaxID=330153 RepID=A0A7J6M4R7_PERCH|nr:hypothetical protein FOL47_004041 [Perkinsus chesapeaki]
MDITSISDTLSRAQRLLLRPLSPTVAERENYGKTVTKSETKRVSAVKTYTNRKMKKDDSRSGLYGDAYRNALDALDELTLEMKGKMRGTIRQANIKEKKSTVGEKYDEEKVCKMKKNIEKLEKQLETVKGQNRDQFQDTTGMENAKARLRAQKVKRADTLRELRTVERKDAKDEETKIRLLQQRAANTLREMARERRQRLQNDMVKAEEDRRRRSLDEEKALKEQRAAAERVADRIRRARVEEAKNKELEEHNAQLRINADRKKVISLQRRTKQRIKSVIGKNEKSRSDITSDGRLDGRVEYARRLAATRAREARNRLMQEKKKEAAEELERLELRQQQKEEIMKRYRTRSAGVTGAEYSGMSHSLVDPPVGDQRSLSYDGKYESIKLPQINGSHSKATVVEDSVRVVADVKSESLPAEEHRQEAFEDLLDDNDSEFATPEYTPPSKGYSSTPSSPTSVSEGHTDAIKAEFTLPSITCNHKWRPLVPMMDDEYFVRLVKHGVAENELNKGYALKGR